MAFKPKSVIRNSTVVVKPANVCSSVIYKNNFLMAVIRESFEIAYLRV